MSNQIIVSSFTYSVKSMQKAKTNYVNTDDLYLESGTANDSLAVPLLTVVRQLPSHPTGGAAPPMFLIWTRT